MPMKLAPLLARLLFPNSQAHHQRRQFNQLFVAILIGLVVAALVGLIMFQTANTYFTR